MNTAFLVMKALDIALMVGEFTVEDRDALESSSADLKVILREGRDPTDAEWAEINQISDGLLSKLADRAAQA